MRINPITGEQTLIVRGQGIAVNPRGVAIVHGETRAVLVEAGNPHTPK